MRKNILKILEKINKIDNIEKQIIVINDGSNDNTLSILKMNVQNYLMRSLIVKIIRARVMRVDLVFKKRKVK